MQWLKNGTFAWNILHEQQLWKWYNVKDRTLYEYIRGSRWKRRLIFPHIGSFDPLELHSTSSCLSSPTWTSFISGWTFQVFEGHLGYWYSTLQQCFTLKSWRFQNFPHLPEKMFSSHFHHQQIACFFIKLRACIRPSWIQSCSAGSPRPGTWVSAGGTWEGRSLRVCPGRMLPGHSDRT